MDKNNLVSFYEFRKYNYQNIHSAGPDIVFERPCIGYVKKGYVKFFYKGNTIYAHEGDLIYIAYKTVYQSIWYGTPSIEWYSINFDFNSKYAFCDYPFQILENYPCELFDAMYQSYENSPFVSVSHFYELLDDIYEKLEKSSANNLYPLIQPAIDYIENNYNEKITIKHLADLCHISESGFFQQFKKASGITPIAYKHNIMIQHAIELLSNTSMPIEEISNVVGFPSSNYFRKIFFKLTNKKPKEIRIKHYPTKCNKTF